MRSSLLFLILVFSFSSSFATSENLLESDIQKTCEWYSNQKPWSYCVFQQTGSTNQDIIYFFHGAGGSANDFGQKWYAFREDLRARGKAMPTVIGISFGPIWLLAEKNSSQQSGLLPYVVGTVMPYMEAKIGGLKGQRFLLSMSMGSFNSSQLILKHPDLFAKAAMACPAISTLSPFAPQAVVDEFISSTPGAERLKVIGNMRMQRTYFPTQEDWSKANPLLIGVTHINELTPPIYLSGDTHDDYGFFKGGETFAQIIRSKRGNSSTWTVHDGGHCVRDQAAMARFLF